MTVDEAIEHGRAWVESGWTWAPGQVALWGRRRVMIGLADATAMVLHCLETGAVVHRGWSSPGDLVPDLRDDGTRGHALGQVRGAWGDEEIYVECDVGRWEVWSGSGKSLCMSDDGVWLFTSDVRGPMTAEFRSEAEALLVARKAAP